MKTEFLKSLGIEDQSVIDKIMAENGKDINSAKKSAENYDTQIEALKEQIKDRDTQLSNLKKSVKDNQDLTDKITQLENDNKEAKTAYENRIADLQKTHAIESAVRDAKAKNVKAVVALLDKDKIDIKDGEMIGLKEQIDSLVAGEDTSFLFGDAPQPVPAGAAPADIDNGKAGDPPASDRRIGGLGLADAVANAFKNNLGV